MVDVSCLRALSLVVTSAKRDIEMYTIVIKTVPIPNSIPDVHDIFGIGSTSVFRLPAQYSKGSGFYPIRIFQLQNAINNNPVSMKKSPEYGNTASSETLFNQIYLRNGQCPK
jgi:hypothetical protein